jgi:polyadenylate-binding protein 2
MKKRLKEMEDEANAVKAAGAGGTDGTSAATGRVDRMGEEYGASLLGASAESDARSIYVGNVDYAATPEELQAHFADCGTINRVTIMCNKATGTPKGFAYIEFVDQDAVKNAVILNESPFRGRALKVTPKRTNVPGLAVRGGRGGRGRGVFGYRGRGSGRGRPRGRWVPY